MVRPEQERVRQLLTEAVGLLCRNSLQFKEEVEQTWWSQFIVQVLPHLVPITKWNDTYPNREVGDIVLVVYPGMKKAEYRLGKVVKVLPDRNGNVRTLEVALHPKDKRTDGKIRYIPKNLEKMVLNSKPEPSLKFLAQCN